MQQKFKISVKRELEAQGSAREESINIAREKLEEKMTKLMKQNMMLII